MANASGDLPTAADLTSILVRHCGLDPQAAAEAPHASLAELGMDSLALLELQAVVADRYRVALPEEASTLSISALATLVDAGATPAVANESAAPTVASEGATSADDEDRESQDTVGHTENSVLIRAPLSLVWELTNDVARWTELFTEYQSVEILNQRGDTVLFRLTMFPDENGVAWSWVSERTMDPVAHRVHARRVETGPFEYMRICWRYAEVPEGTLMTWIQDFAMRPTAPVDDAGMTARINTNSRIQMEIIRNRIERIASQRAANSTTAGAGHE